MIILLLICSHQYGIVLVVGARTSQKAFDGDDREVLLQDESEDDGGFVATVDRVVPSSPDPLHNK
ncbi:hypothetical protein LINPERPRIM_LOCUS1759 [Linum perenne]